LIVDDIGKQRKPVEGVEQVVEHIQKDNQQGTTTSLLEVLVLQMGVKGEGHLG
jgi:hypothetical protein